MSSMNHVVGHNNLRLFSRNEGKIKSYESCRDVRAWSHDGQQRDRYLREWMKCDMPICVLPSSVIARFLKAMTYRCRGRATPRCHPDCKSKVLLDSICNSCHAMKECLKNEEEFDKYFDDEEFETSHWPCERCLEALKSIKMFWKIIVEKIFNISLPKGDEKVRHECCFTDSVQSVAKAWQTDMLKQAMYVKNYSPCCLPLPCWDGKGKSEIAPCNLRPCGYNDLHTRSCVRVLSKPDCRTNKCCKNKSTDTDFLSNPIVSITKKLFPSLECQNKHCTAKIKMINKVCECSKDNEEIAAYKTNLDFLQEKCNCQRKEIERLKKENSSLKIELQNVYKNSSWKSSFNESSKCSLNHKTIALLPKPFECYAEECPNKKQIKGIDSEMIITMKNCKNETYRHISLLQVLHKTNDPAIKDQNTDCACGRRKEDPIELLTKVQNTFGAIVKREMDTIANNKKQCGMKSDIDATFHRLNTSRSAPSCCSTITLGSTDSHHVWTRGRNENAKEGDDDKNCICMYVCRKSRNKTS